MQRCPQKGKIESNKQNKEGGQRNKFMEKSGVPDRVKNRREVDHSKNRSRTKPGFVKHILDVPKKKQNLIKGRRLGQKPA